mmetsp:Transcript_59047/g.71080  ORF Transcript_59047/g.71080 Transcript_59047/m.71080 type:complete len:204 (+) Transcript_59047:833-1444(+)
MYALNFSIFHKSFFNSSGTECDKQSYPTPSMAWFRRKEDTFSSRCNSVESTKLKIKSKRERRGASIPVFPTISLFPSKRPPLGFATAITVVRQLSLHTIPALAIERVCCSIASCIVVRSSARTQPNSSIQHTPRSANTRAPASKEKSFDPSLTAAAVRPADVVPTPVVRTDRGDRAAANRRNWDLPVPGSPTKRIWDCSLRLV